MKSMRVTIDLDVEYDDTVPGEFARAMEIVQDLLDLEIDSDQVKVVLTRSYS
jgi:hypothetical protein